MSNLIQLLPDSVANQIAAGEVIQRPASVIKELMENAIDAGATDVKIILKDGGKTLIQVIDNGCGMSETDARMAFERHATSKIKDANDLFALKTMGFRGEALASIAAIAHVELKTRRENDELGTLICISGTEVQSQEPVQCSVGSQFLIRDLFYNVPARRRFLKSDSVELRNLINEFQRVVLANSNIAFTFIHNDVTTFQLPAGNRLQRIVNLIGKQIGSKLVPIETKTQMVTISGYIGNPDSAKKTKVDQYFFVNDRYMRHPYLHKAVLTAYENIIAPDTSPAYFIYLKVDPQIIDVNIHPTKTEIKFEDERAIWQILSAAIRESIGKFNLMPSIDFDTADSIDIPVTSPTKDFVEPSIEVNPFYNPFEEDKKRANTYLKGGSGGSYQSGNSYQRETVTGWEDMFGRFEAERAEAFPTETGEISYDNIESEPVQQTILSSGGDHLEHRGNRFFQLKNKYILTSVKSGLMMIDQKRAHERVIFEKFMQSLHNGASLSQKCLFPEELHFSPEEKVMVADLQADLLSLGLELTENDEGVFLVQSIPAGLENSSPKELIDGILTDYQHGEVDLQLEVREQIAGSLAKRAAMPYGKLLSEVEMVELFDHLFACQIPNFSPSGKPIISILDNDELDKRFSS